MSKLLLAGVLGTMGWIIIAGLTPLRCRRAPSAFPPGAFTLSHNFFLGLGSAMLIATYDYWGYYNVCFLGDEVKDPGKTIPRALLLSILLVGCLYIVMNISILGVVPWQEMHARRPIESRLVCGFDFHAEDLRDVGGEPGDRPGDVDGIRLGLLAAARILARAVRGGARRQLFSGVRPSASAAPLSLRFAAGAGWRGRFCSASSRWPM